MTINVGVVYSGNATSGIEAYKRCKGSVQFSRFIGVGPNCNPHVEEFCTENHIGFTHLVQGTNEEISNIIEYIFTVANVDIIILSGYMRQLKGIILKTFANKIVNVHPADTNTYGGKGMYGENVYKAVLASEDVYITPTLHFVDYDIDTGRVIMKRVIPISKTDSYETLKPKIQEAEAEMLFTFLNNTEYYTKNENSIH